MPRGRPKNTEARREQIVEGLLDVIAEHGYDGASIVAIARAAGLAPGGVHYHFKTKQDVLIALASRLGDTLRRRWELRMSDAGPDPLLRLDAFIDAHLALQGSADPRAVAAWVVIAAESLRRPEVRFAYAAVVDERLTTLRSLCGACLREALGSAHGAAAAAAAILAAIEGAYALATAAPQSIPPGTAAPTIRKMARSLLTA